MTTLHPEPGEQLVTIYNGHGDPLFPAKVADIHWNGFACPSFRRPVADAVVEWINATADADPVDATRAAWDGDTVVITDSCYADNPGYTPERIGPDRHGRYPIGAFGWCWQVAIDVPPTTAPTTATADSATVSGTTR